MSLTYKELLEIAAQVRDLKDLEQARAKFEQVIESVESELVFFHNGEEFDPDKLLVILRSKLLIIDNEWKRWNIVEATLYSEELLSLIELAKGKDLFSEDKNFEQEVIEIEGRCLNTFGILLADGGDYEGAITRLKRALSIQMSLDNKGQVGGIYSNIARIYLLVKDYETSLEYSYKAVDIARSVGNTEWEGNSTGNIALLYKEMGNYDKAEQYVRKSIEISSRVGSKSAIARHYNLWGQILTLAKDYGGATEKIKIGLELRETLPNKQDVAISHLTLGQLFSVLESEAYDYKQAKYHILSALRTFEEYSDMMGLEGCYNSLASIEEFEGNFREAAEYLRKVIECKEKSYSQSLQQAAVKFKNEHRLELMKKVQETTDEILLKTFPASIVPALREGRFNFVEHFDSASVLFADIVGFTELATKMKPEDLVFLLNSVFTIFDTLAAKYSCERLKTIGDGYMASAGVPIRSNTHAIDIVRFASALIVGIQVPENCRHLVPLDTTLNIRVGIHSGPLVGGITGGLVKIQYDLYGDTVNTASRMESNGKAGLIHCSEEFKNTFEYQSVTF